MPVKGSHLTRMSTQRMLSRLYTGTLNLRCDISGWNPDPVTTWTGFGKTVQTCLNHVQTCLSLYRNVKPVYTWYVHVYTMYIQICNCTYVSVQICNLNSCLFHVHRQEFTNMNVHSTDMYVHLSILNLNTVLTASSL
jgi:hypothetical protein